jgi:SAM-dependent methyltransferase
MGPVARYDDAAEWYAERTRGWYREPALLVPEGVAGQRILDLACGQGHLSRWLADRGATVVAVDLSSRMLEVARRETDAAATPGIEFVHGDATTVDWWDGVAFDGVACHMALMDIDDLDAALATAFGVLRAGGWLSFSVFHPCYPGGPEGSESGLPSWPPDRGYRHEGWWTTGGDGVRGRVGAVHRMLSTYLNAATRAGFTLTNVDEHGENVPTFLLVHALKPTTA